MDAARIPARVDPQHDYGAAADGSVGTAQPTPHPADDPESLRAALVDMGAQLIIPPDAEMRTEMADGAPEAFRPDPDYRGWVNIEL